MKQVRTAKIKTSISAEDILPTIRAYTNGFNLACQLGFSKKIKSKKKLHNEVYYTLKDTLPSQLSCSVISKSLESLKAQFSPDKKFPSCPVSKQQSIRYDCNSYTLNLQKKTLSVSTISGRKKYSFELDSYSQQKYAGWRHTSAELMVRKNTVWLHIVFEQEDGSILEQNGKYVGVDRGINQIAVTSDGKFFGEKKLKNLVNKQRSLRKKLQKKGTRSAKRHLRRLRGKEQRFRADINHKISKKIVESMNSGDTLVLENLSGIRNQRLRKTARTMIHNWSFFQLEEFIKYKAEAKGISIIKVNPAYTSQQCSFCGHIDKANRKSSSFKCLSCNFQLHADLNAARNIRMRGEETYTASSRASSIMPNVPTVGTSPPALAVGS